MFHRNSVHLRQENHGFVATLSYQGRSCLKQKKANCKSQLTCVIIFEYL